ncbi:hypothetical protein INR49_020665 [Caranx melampygus]|nr:hypothetical protein INR49_020665 [Caranx melampygus]
MFQTEPPRRPESWTWTWLHVLTACPPAETLEPLVSPEEPWEPQRPERPSDLVIPAAPNMSSDLSLSSSSDGGDMTCSDLLSLRSDSLSLASDPTVSRRVSHQRQRLD